jgi:hypothetical protein
MDNSYSALVRVGWYADRDGSLAHPHVVVDLSGASSGVSSGVSSGLSDSGSMEPHAVANGSGATFCVEGFARSGTAADSRSSTVQSDIITSDVSVSLPVTSRAAWLATISATTDNRPCQNNSVSATFGVTSNTTSEETSGLSDSGSDFVRLIYGRDNNFDMGVPFLPATMTQVSRLWYLCCLVVILLI